MLHLVKSTPFGDFLGKGIYVPDILGWNWTPIAYIAFFVGWYLLARYNERTEKFVISL